MKLFIVCSSNNNILTEYFNACKVLLEELIKVKPFINLVKDVINGFLNFNEISKAK